MGKLWASKKLDFCHSCHMKPGAHALLHFWGKNSLLEDKNVSCTATSPLTQAFFLQRYVFPVSRKNICTDASGNVRTCTWKFLVLLPISVYFVLHANTGFSRRVGWVISSEEQRWKLLSSICKSWNQIQIWSLQTKPNLTNTKMTEFASFRVNTVKLQGLSLQRSSLHVS